jgi:signal transduction histidine kinase
MESGWCQGTPNPLNTFAGTARTLEKTVYDKIIRAVQSLGDDLKEQLRELRESVDDLRSAIEGP